MKRIMGAGSVALLLACGADPMATESLNHVPGALVVTGWSSTVPTNAGTGGNVQWSSSLTSGSIGPEQVIVAPDTVAAGEPFEVVTWTVGVSGCWRSDGQTTELQERVVAIRPYDSHSGSEVCTGMLVFLDHRSTVQLDEPGDWVLRVHGRKLRQGNHRWWEPISAERPIHVRP